MLLEPSSFFSTNEAWSVTGWLENSHFCCSERKTHLRLFQGTFAAGFLCFLCDLGTKNFFILPCIYLYYQIDIFALRPFFGSESWSWQWHEGWNVINLYLELECEAQNRVLFLQTTLNIALFNLRLRPRAQGWRSVGIELVLMYWLCGLCWTEIQPNFHLKKSLSNQ